MKWTHNFNTSSEFLCNLLNGEYPPKKVGGRKKSYFLKFMNVGVTRNLVGAVLLLLL